MSITSISSSPRSSSTTTSLPFCDRVLWCTIIITLSSGNKNTKITLDWRVAMKLTLWIRKICRLSINPYARWIQTSVTLFRNIYYGKIGESIEWTWPNVTNHDPVLAPTFFKFRTHGKEESGLSTILWKIKWNETSG